MGDLAKKKCGPCEKGVAPLKGNMVDSLLSQIGEGWEVIDDHHLEKSYEFRNFKEALAFTNRVGEVAEEEGHHPDIALSWGKVKITLWTHKIDGLSKNDFIMAAKCDRRLAS